MGFQMEVLGQDGSAGLHELDLIDDVCAPADVAERSLRVAEQGRGRILFNLFILVFIVKF